MNNLKIFGKILGVLYSIIFTFILFGLSLLICGFSLFNSSSYKKIIDKIDLSEVKINDLGIDGDEGTTLKDFVIDQFGEIGIDKETSEKIIENDEIKDVVEDLFEEAIEYSTENGEIPSIDKDDIKSILENEEVKKVMGDKYSEEDIDKMVDEANAQLKEIFKDRSVSDVGSN